jgi:hypothetical protein
MRKYFPRVYEWFEHVYLVINYLKIPQYLLLSIILNTNFKGKFIIEIKSTADLESINMSDFYFLYFNGLS